VVRFGASSRDRSQGACTGSTCFRVIRLMAGGCSGAAMGPVDAIRQPGRPFMTLHDVVRLLASPDTLRHAHFSNLLSSNPRLDSGSQVRFAAVGAYSLDLEVSAYVLTSDDHEFSRIQQEPLLRILETVESTGARLALPTQASINYSAYVAGTGKDSRPTDGDDILGKA
jgi:hypothetical protein